mgnify:CR=1 FL=1
MKRRFILDPLIEGEWYMVSIKDYGIDKLSAADRLELAQQIWESLDDCPPGVWDEAELEAEEARREAELDAHPERALTYEEFRRALDKKS